MKSGIIFLLFFSVSSFVYSAIIPPVVPGQSLYSISQALTTGVNILGRGVSSIDTNLENLSGSNLEQVASFFDVIASNASQAELITMALVSDLTQIESVLDDLGAISSQIAGIEANLNEVASTTETINSNLITLDSKIEVIQSLTDNLNADISSMDQFVSQVPAIAIIVGSSYDTLTQVDSKIDALTTAVNSISGSASSYDTLTQIDSKIDSLTSAVDALSTSSSSCNLTPLVSNIDTLTSNLAATAAVVNTTYATVSQIDTKVDTLTTNLAATTATVNNVYTVATQIDTKVDTLTTNLAATTAVVNNTYTVATQIDTKVDTLTTNLAATTVTVNNVYTVATQIDTKVDTLTTNLAATTVTVNNTYSTASQIDSKVDALREVPNFIETPTAFSPVSILSNTSAYFCRPFSITVSGASEQFIGALTNSGTHIVRISGFGMTNANTAISSDTQYSIISLYKAPTFTSAPIYTSITGSGIEYATSASVTSFGTIVFQTYVAGSAGTSQGSIVPFFTFIPKEVYSVIIAPGETLVASTTTIASSGTINIYWNIIWEEIITP